MEYAQRQFLRPWSHTAQMVLSFRLNPDIPDAFSSPGSLNNIIQKLQGVLRQTGASVEEPLAGRRLAVQNVEDVRLDHTLQAAAKQLDLLFIVLPAKNLTLYPKIKRLCDVNYGLQTICCVGSKLKVERGQDQYLRNIALKFNLKLGGTNQMVDNLQLSLISENKTMVVGLDVTHPTGSKSIPANAPSVAGMVASADNLLGQWPATIQIQSRARKEEVDNLITMLKRHLGLWKLLGQHASYPENILVYRDGVSEDQYSKILAEELPLLRRACKETYPSEKTSSGLPRITIVIVNKRHHSRFFPTTTDDADKNGNTPPGTLVDRGVTEPHCFSFFVQPHAARRGTAKTTFYFMALDEIFSQRYSSDLLPGFSNIADVQDLTLSQSCLIGKSTKGARVCCPVQYADLACDRARCYLTRS